MSLLEVNNLKTWYPVKSGFLSQKRYVKAVDGVNFSIEKGETVGLVGESGCGKSTLGRTLLRLEEITSGTFSFDGVELSSLKGKELLPYRKKIQMIFQDPYASLNPKMKIFSMLDEILLIHTDFDATGRIKKIKELFDMVGLNQEHIYRYPHQFSGGQRQRIGIARALAVKPDLIIADEPVSALDVSIQAQIINLMKKIQEKTQISYLFIAHDLAVVEHISDKIIVMYLGKIIEQGSSSQICDNPKHPYTKALLSAIPQIDEKKQKRIILEGDIPSPISPPSGCLFHPRCPIAQERCKKEVPSLSDGEHQVRCFFND